MNNLLIDSCIEWYDNIISSYNMNDIFGIITIGCLCFISWQLSLIIEVLSR